MLEIAHKDLKSLRHMLDPEEHDDEIFGFHMQQATEKALKAWIASKNLRYELTHDLSALLRQLEDNHEDVEELWHLVEYTIYGVRYRYESLAPDEDTIDRDVALREASRLIERVQNIVGQ